MPLQDWVLQHHCMKVVLVPNVSNDFHASSWNDFFSLQQFYFVSQHPHSIKSGGASQWPTLSQANWVSA